MAVVIGIVLASIILWLTGHFTGTDKRPTQDVAKTSLTGAATVVAVRHRGRSRVGRLHRGDHRGGGLRRVPARWRHGHLSLFLIALAGCGLLTTVGVIVAMDTFGPVSDNAQGIAEMSGDVDEEGARSSPSSTPSATPPRPSPRGSRSRRRCWRRPRCSGPTRGNGRSARRWAQRTWTRSRAVPPRRPHRRSTRSCRCPRAVRLPDRHAERAGRAAARRGRRVPVLRPGDQRRDPRRRCHRVRGAPPVPREPRDHGLHQKPEYGKVVDIYTRDSLRELATPGLLAALAPVAVGFGLGIGRSPDTWPARSAPAP